MQQPIRWGIVGVGYIARKFAADLVRLPGARLVAVASRSPERAGEFAREFSVPGAYGSYEALAADPDVDVAYVATRNQAHAPAARILLEHGKAVLCEKPFTLNAAELRTLIELARRRRCFLMEAMWTRFFPAIQRCRELLAQGAIGEVRTMTADFGHAGGQDPKGRLLNAEFGGGALLDVGVYTLSLAYMMLGRPQSVCGQAVLGPTGVDEQCVALLKYASGQLALLSAAVNVDYAKQAVFYGTRGRLTIECPLWKPDTLTLVRDTVETIRLPYEMGGYQFKILEVMDCLRRGQLESSIMPLDESLAILETMDALRVSWGLRYPGET